MSQRQYLLVKERAQEHGQTIRSGTLVYEPMVPDFGLAAIDTRRAGKLCVSVSLTPDGTWPLYAVLRDDLEEVVRATNGATDSCSFT